MPSGRRRSRVDRDGQDRIVPGYRECAYGCTETRAGIGPCDRSEASQRGDGSGIPYQGKTSSRELAGGLGGVDLRRSLDNRKANSRRRSGCFKDSRSMPDTGMEMAKRRGGGSGRAGWADGRGRASNDKTAVRAARLSCGSRLELIGQPRILSHRRERLAAGSSNRQVKAAATYPV